MATRKVRYRRLKPGEVIQKGDQFLYSPGVWKTTRSAGCMVNGGFGVTEYRRRVETPKPAEQIDYKAIVEKIAAVFGLPPWMHHSTLLDWLTGRSAEAKRNIDRIQGDYDTYAENAKKVVADLKARLAAAETACKNACESRDVAHREVQRLMDSYDALARKPLDYGVLERKNAELTKEIEKLKSDNLRMTIERDTARAVYDSLAEACRVIGRAGWDMQGQKDREGDW